MAYRIHRLKGDMLLDANGVPFVGGTFAYFEAGTTTPLTVYKDGDGATPWGVTVVLDGTGRLTDPIFVGEDDFKETFTPPNGEAAVTFDGYPGAQVPPVLDSARPITPIGIAADAVVVMADDDIGTVKDLDTSANNITFVLMDPSDLANGERITVRKVAVANSITVSGPINGGTAVQLSGNADAVTLVSNGVDGYEVTAFVRAGLLEGNITSEDLDPRVVGGLAQVGDIKIVATETPPDGWLECDGAAVSRTDRADLFAKIGTRWGEGDGATTFNLPDFRGRFLRIWDHGAGRDPNAVTLTVTGAANNGSGLIRLTLASTATLATGMLVAVASVGGVPNATGEWACTVIDSTHIDLVASTWSGTFTSGGTIDARTRSATGGAVGDHVGTVQGFALERHVHTATQGGSTTVDPGAGAPVGSVPSIANTSSTGSVGQFGSETRPLNANVMAIIMADPAAAAGSWGSVNTLLSGSGPPSSGLGNDGDFYIDTLNDEVFGPKTAGAWGTGVPYIGANGVTVPDISGLSVLASSAVASNDMGIVYDASAGGHKSFYIGKPALDPCDPEFGAAGTGGSDDTAALLAAATAAVAAKRALRLRPGLIFRISSITFPNNLILEARGATIRSDGTVTGNTSIITTGTGTMWDHLLVTTPGTTSDRIVLIQDNCRFGTVEAVADSQVANANDSFDAAVRILGNSVIGDTIRTANYDCGIMIASATAVTPRTDVKIGTIMAESYLRGLKIRNFGNVSVDLIKMIGASANASVTAGHNGALIVACQDLNIGRVHIEDSGEHGLRMGGQDAVGEQDTKNVTIGSVTAIRPGQCGVKINAPSGQRFANISIGKINTLDCAATSSTGTNEDALRVEDVDGGSFGPVTALLEAKGNSCNDGIYIADSSKVSVQPGSYIDKPKRSGVYLDEASDSVVGLLSDIHVGKVTINTSDADGVVINAPTTTIANVTVDADVISPTTYSWNVTANAVTAPCILRGNSHSPGTGHYNGSSDTDVIKDFTASGARVAALKVPDDAYASGWNASAEVPTKNAVYDKVETMAAKSQTFGEGVFIEFPDNKTYTVRLKIPFAGTITETTTKCTSGSCTATFKLNGVALGGTANAVTSSEQSQAHASSNTFAANDDLEVTISSNSSCLDLAASMLITRALA